MRSVYKIHFHHSLVLRVYLTSESTFVLIFDELVGVVRDIDLAGFRV